MNLQLYLERREREMTNRFKNAEKLTLLLRLLYKKYHELQYFPAPDHIVALQKVDVMHKYQTRLVSLQHSKHFCSAYHSY